LPNSSVYVIHSIQKNGGGVYWIYAVTINRDMSFFVQRLMLVDVPPPNCQTLVPLPHEEHFVHKMSKVWIVEGKALNGERKP
jgi:hypothetical protein